METFFLQGLDTALLELQNILSLSHSFLYLRATPVSVDSRWRICGEVFEIVVSFLGCGAGPGTGHILRPWKKRKENDIHLWKHTHFWYKRQINTRCQERDMLSRWTLKRDKRHALSTFPFWQTCVFNINESRGRTTSLTWASQDQRVI